MDILLIIVSIFFIIRIISNLFYWVNRIQVYGYNINNFIKDYLLIRKNTWLNLWLLIKLIILIIFIPTIFNEGLLFTYHLLVVFIFLFDFFILIENIKTNRSILPYVSIKSFLLIFLSWLIVLLLFFNPIIDFYFWLLIIDKLLLVIIFVFWIGLFFPFEIYDNVKIRHLKIKINKLKDLKIILISGNLRTELVASYIYQLISKKQKVFSIDNTINEGNVVEKINNILTEQTTLIINKDISKKEEISIFSELLKPNIIIFNNLLSNSIKNSLLQKKLQMNLELLKVFPKVELKLISVFSNKVIRSYINFRSHHEPRNKKSTYCFFGISNKVDSEDKSVNSMLVESYIINKTSTSFIVKYDNEKHRFKAPLIGIDNVLSLLPALIIAKKLKFTINDLKNVISCIIPMNGYMLPYHFTNKAILIDYSKAKSIKEVESAVEYMKLYKGKKILVLTSITDFLDFTEEDVYKLMNKISVVCDNCVILDKKSYIWINNNLKKITKYNIVTNNEITKLIKQLSNKEDIIIFIGDKTTNLIQNILMEN